MFSWLRFLRRTRNEQQLDEEIQAHIAIETQQRIERGETPGQAAANARKDFGNITAVKEITRVSWTLVPVEQFVQDVRFAWRTARRYRGFTAGVILILGLTIGANAAIFSVVNAVLLQPLPYTDADRVVTFDAINRSTGRISSGFTPGVLLDLEQSGVFDSAALSVFTGKNLTGAGDPEELQGTLVSTSFFQVAGVQPFIGRAFASGEGNAGKNRVVIFAHEVWQRRFGGNTEIVGKDVFLDGEPYTLVGVLPPGFIYPDGSDIDFYLPEVLSAADLSVHTAGGHLAFARVKNSAGMVEAQAAMDDLSKRLELQYPQQNTGISLRLVPVKERLTGFYRSSLMLLQAAVVLILLIGCANLANLFLCRARERSREIVTRAALGASRRRLIQQVLLEGMLLAAAGAVVGLALTASVSRVFPALLPDVPRIGEIAVDRNLLAFTGAMAVLSALLFSLPPILRIAKVDLLPALARSSRRHRIGSVLVGAEMAMTLMLLLLAGLTINSLIRLHRVEPGFDYKNILTMELRPPGFKYFQTQDSRIPAFYEDVLRRVAEVPGVKAVAAASYIPMVGVSGGPVQVESESMTETARVRVVTSGYFRTLSIPVLKGRDFSDADRRGSPNVAIVNETMAQRLWNSRELLEQSVAMEVMPRNRMEFKVVGIAQDVLNDPYMPARPEIYVPLPQLPESYPSVYLTVKTAAAPESRADAVRDQIWKVNKDQPVAAIASYETLIRRNNGYAYFLTFLEASFGVLALALAGSGIYSVVSYTAAQRRREIGIRTALGAERIHVLKLVLDQAAPPVLLGTLAGIALSMALATYANRRLPLFLFQITATDALTYSAVTLFLLTLAGVAAYLPARRAVAVDPVKVLRHEA